MMAMHGASRIPRSGKPFTTLFLVEMFPYSVCCTCGNLDLPCYLRAGMSSFSLEAKVTPNGKKKTQEINLCGCASNYFKGLLMRLTEGNPIAIRSTEDFSPHNSTLECILDKLGALEIPAAFFLPVDLQEVNSRVLSAATWRGGLKLSLSRNHGDVKAMKQFFVLGESQFVDVVVTDMYFVPACPPILPWHDEWVNNEGHFGCTDSFDWDCGN
ncbi:hypothetical protein MUK42_35536, partial [Musa troglodytarum]